jgi:hypothetical protein
MIPITPAEIRRILETTDSLQIHRESVTIPLAKEGPGRLSILPGGRLEIVGPADRPFDAWLAEMPARLAELDLGALRKAEDPD